MPSRASIPRVAAAVILAAAALGAVLLIVRYGVNTPVGDEILIGEFLVKNHGRVVPAFGDLIAQHNESRKFFPRLVFFYLARITGWNMKYEMLISVALVTLAVAGIWSLARRTFDETTALIVTTSSGLILFSPIHWWNWLSGIQIVAFTPLLMLTCALLALRSDRFALAAAASVVATFSYASGMLVWFLLLPAVWLYAWRAPIVRTAIWAGLAAASIAFYFQDYVRPRGHPPLVMPFAAPSDFAAYCLAFLGHPLAWKRDRVIAAAAGAVILAIFLVCAIAAMRTRERFAAALPWITIGGYALGCAVTTAMGRLPLGLSQALEPRYFTFSAPLIVGSIGLAALAPQRTQRAQRFIALVALAVLHVAAIAGEWRHMIFIYREHLMARALVQFALVNPDRSPMWIHVFPDPDHAIRVIDDLDRIGYLSPRAIRSRNLRELDGLVGELGAINSAGRLSPSRWRLDGWASLPGNRPADTVLIARVTPEGDELVGIASRIALPREDIGSVVPALRESGWTYDLRIDGATAGGWSAWAYDGSNRRAYRLANAFSIPSQREEALQKP